MNYSEAAYFDRNACQHVADWLDNQRLRNVIASSERLRRCQVRFSTRSRTC